MGGGQSPCRYELIRNQPFAHSRLLTSYYKLCLAVSTSLALPDTVIRSRGSPPLVPPSTSDPITQGSAHVVELLWSEASPSLPPTRTVLPDDDVSDELLPEGLALRRAVERYPVTSIVTGATPPGTLREAFTQASQRRFRTTLDTVDPRILARLDQPFGKDNLSQRFYSTPGLRHVLLPLWKSGFLYDDPESWSAFCTAYFPATILRDLLREYGDVPFAGNV